MIETTTALVDRISPLSDTIIQLVLKPEKFIDYEPGQYLQIMANDHLSYSIANAPLGSHHYELHIRHEGGNPYEQPLFSQIKKEGKIPILLPFGDCYLARLQPSKPIIFIAGGTGFAPIKAMIEQLLATGDRRRFELYWGARSQSDLYLDTLVRQWQTHARHFCYFSSLPAKDNRDSLVSLVLERHIHDLKDFEIVIAGPFDMVYALRDRLLAAEVQREQLYSDAFSFEQ